MDKTSLSEQAKHKFSSGSATPLDLINELASELTAAQVPFIDRLASILEASGGQPLESAEEKRQFAKSVNQLLDRLGVRINGPEGERCRLRVKTIKKDYLVFGLVSSSKGYGSRVTVPEGLELC